MILGNFFVAGVLAVFAAVVSLMALKHFPLPYVWMALSWIGVLLCMVVLLPRARRVALLLSAIVGGLATVEVSIWYVDNRVHADIEKGGTFTWVEHEILGYVASKDTTQSSILIFRGDKLYDVNYTMDGNGFRITRSEPTKSKDPEACVLLFGDSFTFGWGLNDKDTMPYQLARQLGPKYDVYNLAFLTHGPHQMLASFENGFFKQAVKCKVNEPHYILYQTTPDHVRRVAGLRDRVDLHRGPQYSMAGEGKISYQGQFGDNLSTRRKIEAMLSRSSLFRRLAGGNAMYTRAFRQDDLDLYFAVVENARSRMRGMYPQSEMHILFWGGDSLDTQGALRDLVLMGLKDRGFPIHRIDEILPGADQFKAEYFLRGFDPHPNSATNERIARYLTTRVVR